MSFSSFQTPFSTNPIPGIPYPSDQPAASFDPIPEVTSQNRAESVTDYIRAATDIFRGADDVVRAFKGLPRRPGFQEYLDASMRALNPVPGAGSLEETIRQLNNPFGSATVDGAVQKSFEQPGGTSESDFIGEPVVNYSDNPMIQNTRYDQDFEDLIRKAFNLPPSKTEPYEVGDTVP